MWISGTYWSRAGIGRLGAANGPGPPTERGQSALAANSIPSRANTKWLPPSLSAHNAASWRRHPITGALDTHKPAWVQRSIRAGRAGARDAAAFVPERKELQRALPQQPTPHGQRPRRAPFALPRQLRPRGGSWAGAAAALTSWAGRGQHGGKRRRGPAFGGRARPFRRLGLLLVARGQTRRAAEPRAGAERLQLEPGAAGPVDGGVVSNGRSPAWGWGGVKRLTLVGRPQGSASPRPCAARPGAEWSRGGLCPSEGSSGLGLGPGAPPAPHLLCPLLSPLGGLELTGASFAGLWGPVKVFFGQVCVLHRCNVRQYTLCCLFGAGFCWDLCELGRLNWAGSV